MTISHPEVREKIKEELSIDVRTARLTRLTNVVNVVGSLQQYTPLTVRQVFYQLVKAELLKNSQAEYKNISKDLGLLRHACLVDWNDIEDRSRRITAKRGWTSMDEYINYFVNSFQPEYYSRCLIQTQPKMVEVWIEKDALSTIVESITWPFCLRMVVARGHSSKSFKKLYVERAEAAMRAGKQPVILYLGDLDPSGIECFEAAQRSFENDFHLHGVKYKRIALNPDQISAYNLPSSLDAIKETDPNYLKYKKRFGRVAVELDALHPEDLQNIVRSAIEQELDLDEISAQKEIEIIEREKLITAKHEVKRVLVETLM